MRFLKIAVVVMGVLIVAGTTTLVVVVFHRLSSLPPSHPTAPLDEPSGTRIISMVPVADGLALALTGGGEPDRIVVIDPATGHVLRRILLHP